MDVKGPESRVSGSGHKTRDLTPSREVFPDSHEKVLTVLETGRIRSVNSENVPDPLDHKRWGGERFRFLYLVVGVRPLE